MPSSHYQVSKSSLLCPEQLLFSFQKMFFFPAHTHSLEGKLLSLLDDCHYVVVCAGKSWLRGLLLLYCLLNFSVVAFVCFVVFFLLNQFHLHP